MNLVRYLRSDSTCAGFTKPFLVRSVIILDTAALSSIQSLHNSVAVRPSLFFPRSGVIKF